MAIITWNNEMSVGVEVLDAQHRKIIWLINNVHEAMISGKEKAFLAEIFDELVLYTGYHFGAEEKFFQQFGYAATDSHVQDHVALTRKVVALKKAFENDEILIDLETLNFLKDWLTVHIMKVDKQYSSFLNSKGVH